MADGTKASPFTNSTPLQAFAQADMAAEQLGDFVNLANVHTLSILVKANAAGAADTLTITVEEAEDVAGTNARGVEFDLVSVQAGATLDAGPGRGYHQKLPARADNVNVTGLLTQNPAKMVRNPPPGTDETVPVTGAMETIVTISIPVTRFKVSEGFGYGRVKVQSSAARQGYGLYLIEDAYGGSQVYSNPLT